MNNNSTQIYLPNDLKKKLHLKSFILGYKLNNIYIIFDFINDPEYKTKEKELKVIGSLNQNSDYELQLNFENGLVWSNLSSIVIFFDPPNFKNLEYFSIKPILLQSMGIEKRTEKGQGEIIGKLRKNPAGFKLNTEFGKFLGDLYIWTIQFWKTSLDQIKLNQTYIKIFLYIICYFGGASFFISFLIDLIQLFTFHIYSFYYCALKIYRKQLDIIKSLFQLFRGKKYNVLKNRIDNLNLYSNSNDVFEIDQLLIGTLLFMIMILLLPTTFAIYLMFSIIHIISLMSLNFLENLQIIINFTPLFVILLKLKNSKRLQGGLKFEILGFLKNTSIVKLSNKALTYDEIFKNNLKLFKRAKNFKESIVKNLLSGEIVVIKYDDDLRFRYLMLPENYQECCTIWKYIK
ncbi:unnamed protein product [Candida verbasci]|uniref:Uncharacterized protein n=1 Tax=Candida verbasci TaxID=1227364 RepID=A0A9W4TZD6_9ASCO|nr:unnamed protein product [Candida verbasci]